VSELAESSIEPQNCYMPSNPSTFPGHLEPD